MFIISSSSLQYTHTNQPDQPSSTLPSISETLTTIATTIAIPSYGPAMSILSSFPTPPLEKLLPAFSKAYPTEKAGVTLLSLSLFVSSRVSTPSAFKDSLQSQLGMKLKSAPESTLPIFFSLASSLSRDVGPDCVKGVSAGETVLKQIKR